MKRCLLLLVLIGSVCLLNACGGSSGSTPPPPVAIHFLVSAPAAANVGTVVNFTVTAIDSADSLATSYSGTVRFTSTDGHAALPASSTLVGGMGMFSATLETVGSQTITATDTVKTMITGATNSISVTEGATHLSVTAPSSAVPGTAFNFTVSALDGSNNPVASYAGTVHFISTDGQAVLPSNSALTNGTGAFSATLKTIGPQTVTATDSTTTSITGTSNSIQVSRFTATGSMGSPRESHTATLLRDGKVLIAGGDDGKVSLATVELFDPGNGSFTTTGSMETERHLHTATLLSDGKVLIAGGDDGKVSLATAELFDSGSGSFTATGSLISARKIHTATLLNDGRVLIAGGDNGTTSLDTAELFDPTNGSFASTGNMTIARSGHTATLLKDGKVLIAGPSQTPELYDPSSGSFSATGSMTPVISPSRYFDTATLLNDGTVLVSGGEYFVSGCYAPLPIATATAELFDPTTGSFTATGNMTAMRSSHTATLLTNGEVLVTGGIMWTYFSPGGCAVQQKVSVAATAELFH
jgi:hypothetical protein